MPVKRPETLSPQRHRGLAGWSHGLLSSVLAVTTLVPGSLRALTTDDGSPTLQRVDTGWTYRSNRGAMQEARHVFVAGADLCGRRRARVLEFGFGVGTNFAALLAAAAAAGMEWLDVHAVERSPVPAELLPVFDARAHVLATAATERGSAQDDAASLTLHVREFADHTPDAPFDAVFLDPFGPGDEPESWSLAVMAAAAKALAPDGRLVTYSAAGWIRRNLAAAGLFVATVPGPNIGKREFTIASPSRARLGEVKIRNAPR